MGSGRRTGPRVREAKGLCCPAPNTHKGPGTYTVVVLYELDNPVQDIIQGLPVGGRGRVWSRVGRTGRKGAGWEVGRPGSGAHLQRTLKFLPSATCLRERLLPMASTSVTMSEPKPGSRRTGITHEARLWCGLDDARKKGSLVGLTIIRQIQGAHGACVAHQVLYHLGSRGAQLQVEGGGTLRTPSPPMLGWRGWKEQALQGPVHLISQPKGHRQAHSSARSCLTSQALKSRCKSWR